MRLSVSAPVPKRCEKIALVVRPVGATKPGFTKLEERAPSPHDAQPLVKQVAKRDGHVQPAIPFLNTLSNRLASRYAAKIGSLVDDSLHWSASASLPGPGVSRKKTAVLNISRQSISIRRRVGLPVAVRRLNFKKEQQP